MMDIYEKARSLINQRENQKEEEHQRVVNSNLKTIEEAAVRAAEQKLMGKEGCFCVNLNFIRDRRDNTSLWDESLETTVILAPESRLFDRVYLEKNKIQTHLVNFNLCLTVQKYMQENKISVNSYDVVFYEGEYKKYVDIIETREFFKTGLRKEYKNVEIKFDKKNRTLMFEAKPNCKCIKRGTLFYYKHKDVGKSFNYYGQMTLTINCSV